MQESLDRQQSASSGEEIEDYSVNIRKYNQEIMTKRKSRHSQSSTKSRVPKTKGFDFPLFPEVHGQKSTKSSLSRAGVVRQSSHQRSRRSRTIVPAKSYNSSTTQRTKDQVSYKRVGSRNSEIVETDDEYTAASSEDEDDIKNTVFRANQKKMMVQQQIIAVEHKDASTQYYEETYSRSVYPLRKETETSTAELDSRRRIPEYNLNNIGLHRNDFIKANNRRPMSHRRHSHKAVQQRIIDNYLAQPKVLIVPIVREGKKPHTPRTPSAYSSGYAAQRRRILRKPWLQQSNLSQKSIPMLRESGIGSSNIRFASGVKIHAFETPDSTESFSSGRMMGNGRRVYDQNKEYGRDYYKNPYTHRPTTRKIKRRPRPTSGKNWRSDETDNPRSSSRQRRPWAI